jgi:hypothetical protein
MQSMSCCVTYSTAVNTNANTDADTRKVDRTHTHLSWTPHCQRHDEGEKEQKKEKH